MTTEAERIEHREREGMAWAIRDMLLSAARDETPSAAAVALLAAVRDRAPHRLRQVIDRQGFKCYSVNLPERAELFDHLKTSSQDMAGEYLDKFAATIGQGRARNEILRFQATDLAQRGKSLLVGLKSWFVKAVVNSPF